MVKRSIAVFNSRLLVFLIRITRTLRLCLVVVAVDVVAVFIGVDPCKMKMIKNKYEKYMIMN